MSSDTGSVSFALLLLPEWRSEARARRPQPAASGRRKTERKGKERSSAGRLSRCPPAAQERGGRRDPGDLARESAMAVSARGRDAMCWNLQRLCYLKEAKHFYTFKKNVPSCCLDLAGAILKALPWVGAPGLARHRGAAAGGPESRSPGLRGALQRLGAQVVPASKPGDPGPAADRCRTSTWTKFHARDVRAPSPEESWRLQSGGPFTSFHRAPQTLFSLP
ncbi:uncharacterized protein LOC128581406 [Nycticebus coucang]|uniref:uncharacterized protein LOC128581406 n=1 Tax=Nycticebus coucang TaxID=9470 RepID=UPI00234C8EEB|nr:uncharacterized protein LOC128581406 [Nycticebus coucang]